MVEFGSGHDWLAIMHYNYNQFIGWSEYNVAVTEVERKEMIREIYELRHYILVQIGASRDELILCDRLRERIELACSMILWARKKKASVKKYYGPQQDNNTSGGSNCGDTSSDGKARYGYMPNVIPH